MGDNMTAAIVVMLIFGGPIAAWIVHRVFAHAEYMAMIRAGMAPPPDPRNMRRAARQGWMPPPQAGIPPTGNVWGAPPTSAPSAPNAYGEYANYYAQRQLHRGMVTAFVGLAVLIGLTLGMGRGPWMLGGLIPMFVGIAQIITAVLSGAQITVPPGAVRVGNPGFGPSPQQQHYTQQPTQTPPPPPPTPETYGGWRPGSMPSIEKPASPPDQR